MQDPKPGKSSEHYQLIETRLQKKMANGSSQCLLCSWRCKLSHGQRGFCQAHVNRHGTLYNLSYGILSAIDVGPIEDKPVRLYRSGTTVMSIGSYGCHFRCGGCHNLDISWGVTALDQLAKGESTAAFVTPEDIIAAALRHNVQGIAFTYSEPAVWLEYVVDVSRLAHEAGLYTVYVSNSFVTDEALQLMAPHIDVLCSDIKSLSDEFYHDICPVGSVTQVLDCIEKAHQLGIHVEVRTNIIPGKNDSKQELEKIALWVYEHLGAEAPWHITRFFPAYKLAHINATPSETLWAAHGHAQKIGLKNSFVYDDKGCDCAESNLPVATYLQEDAASIHQVKRCAASCCGSDGIVLKKYEKDTG